MISVRIESQASCRGLAWALKAKSQHKPGALAMDFSMRSRPILVPLRPVRPLVRLITDSKPPSASD